MIKKTSLFTILLAISINSFASSPRFYKAQISILPKGELGDLSICPLYDNKNIAFTARWDDSNPKHYRMQELMQTNGICGTFFLTCKPWENPMNVKKLCQGGTDVGSHSMTHARLAANLNYNRIFWEVAECKAILESQGDKPLNSYCFADSNYRSMYNKSMEKEIAIMLERTGYSHNMMTDFGAKYQDLEPVSSCYSVAAGDKSPSTKIFEKKLQNYMKESEWLKTNPCLTLGVHVWLYNDAGWNNADAVFKKASGNPDWWYCTQTDYSAYRKMHRLAKIKKETSTENKLNYTITIPFGADIGSDIPLTMAYSSDVKQILIDGKPVRTRNTGSTNFFNIAAKGETLTPKVITYTPNPDNNKAFIEDSIETLQPWLHIEENNLILDLQPSSLISDIRITYILPLMYDLLSPVDIKQIKAFDNKQFIQKLSTSDDEKYWWGNPFILCQIDYLFEGKPQRAFASCFGESKLPPTQDGYRDTTMVSGLFSADEYTDALQKMSIPGAPKISSLDWYGVLEEERLNHNFYTLDIGKRLKPEFDKKLPDTKNLYAIEYNITLDQPKWLVSKSYKGSGTLFVNGESIDKNNRTKIALKQGKNRIITIHKTNPRTYRTINGLAPIYRNY